MDIQQTKHQKTTYKDGDEDEDEDEGLAKTPDSLHFTNNNNNNDKTSSVLRNKLMDCTYSSIDSLGSFDSFRVSLTHFTLRL